MLSYRLTVDFKSLMVFKKKWRIQNNSNTQRRALFSPVDTMMSVTDDEELRGDRRTLPHDSLLMNNHEEIPVQLVWVVVFFLRFLCLDRRNVEPWPGQCVVSEPVWFVFISLITLKPPRAGVVATLSALTTHTLFLKLKTHTLTLLNPDPPPRQHSWSKASGTIRVSFKDGFLLLYFCIWSFFSFYNVQQLRSSLRGNTWIFFYCNSAGCTYYGS